MGRVCLEWWAWPVVFCVQLVHYVRRWCTNAQCTIDCSKTGALCLSIGAPSGALNRASSNITVAAGALYLVDVVLRPVVLHPLARKKLVRSVLFLTTTGFIERFVHIFSVTRKSFGGRRLVSASRLPSRALIINLLLFLPQRIGSDECFAPHRVFVVLCSTGSQMSAAAAGAQDQLNIFDSQVFELSQLIITPCYRYLEAQPQRKRASLVIKFDCALRKEFLNHSQYWTTGALLK